DDPGDELGIAQQVAAMDLEPVATRHTFEELLAAGREVVDNAYVMTPLDQRAAQVGADEARSSRDHHSHPRAEDASFEPRHAAVDVGRTSRGARASRQNR